MKKIYSLTLALCIFCGLSVNAQWTQTNGPFSNATVTCLATDGTNLFAGTTSSGIYYSSNFGGNWNFASGNMGIYPFHCLLLNGSNLFASGDDGMYVSSDNGTTWTYLLGGSFYSTSAMVMNGTTLIAANNGGIFRSTDNGATWASTSVQVNVSLTVCGGVFIAANTNGVFKSTDDGNTWSLVNGAQTSFQTFITNGSNIFAGSNSGGGVLLSTDNGSTWTAKNTGLTSLNVTSFVMNGTDLYCGTTGAGVFKTSNSGTNWVAENTGISTTWVNALAIMGADIFAGTPNTGVYLSSNFGTSWAQSNNGMITSDVRALNFNGSDLFGGSNGAGVFLTSSSGANWNVINSGVTNLTVTAFATIGVNTFAGTSGGVFLTTNNGASWAAVNTGLGNTNVTSLQVIGTNLFAGTFGGGVYLTTNNGTGWSAVNTGLSRLTVNTLTACGSNLFAGTDNSGIFMSSNNGGTWTTVNSGLPLDWIYSMSTSGSNIYAVLGSSSGVWLSTDNGTSWTQRNTGMYGDVYSVYCSGSNVFAFGGFMNVSTDNGMTWNNITSGLPNIDLYGFAASGNTVFVGTTGLGVWKRQLNEILCSVNPPVMSSTSSTSICSGGAVNIPLTNTGVAATYSWVASSNPGVTGISTTPQGSSTLNNTITNTSDANPATVTYTVTPTGISGGCAGTPQMVTVTVNPSPVMTSNSTLTICSGQAVGLALTSSSPASYVWSASPNGNTAGQSISSQSGGTITDVLTNLTLNQQTVMYTIAPTATLGGCAGTTQTLTVNVNPTPNMTSASSATICSGETVNMNLTSDLHSDFTWIATANPSTSGESTNFQSTSTLSNTIQNNTTIPQVITYTITPTAIVGGCSGSQIFSLTVNPAPNMTSANSATICSGSAVSIGLTSDISAVYAWNASTNPNTSGESVSPQSSNTVNDMITDNSTSAQIVYYSVTPTSTLGCVGAPQSVAVTVNPVPVMTSASSQSICSGNGVNIPLGADIASSFVWNAANNTLVSGESVALQSTGTISDILTNNSNSAQVVVYTVTPTATLGGCPGMSQTVNIVVDPIPVMTSATSATICSGGTVNIPLTSSSSATYMWSAMNNINTSGESTNIQTSSTLMNTISNTSGVPQVVTYNVTPASGSCAGMTQTVSVTVNPEPLMISPASTSLCSGSTLNMTLVSNVNATFNWVATNNANVTGESLSTQSGATLNNTLTNLSGLVQNVVYTVTPTSVSGGCVGSAQNISVLVNPVDNAGFTYSSSTYCQSGNDPSALITGVSGGSFSVGAGLQFQNSSNGLINLAASAPGTYTIRYTTNGTCPNSSTFNVTINQAPAATFSYTGSPYCSATTNPFPVYTGGSVAGIFTANPSGLFFINTATGQVNLTTSTPGTYTVTNNIAASGGCASTNATSYITINPLPVVSFTGLAATYYYNDPAVTLTGAPTGGTFTGASIVGSTFNPSVAGAGTYTIAYTYTDGNGCTNMATHPTTIMGVPAAPSICEVTVDVNGVNNEVYWDNQAYSKVDSFLIYRETGTGYQIVGTQPGNALSTFTDTVRTKYFPNTGNPNAGTYRYKLQIRDSAGNYSPLSPYHNTIFNNKTSGTFTWNAYQIEGQPVPLPSSLLITYDLWRDDHSNGNWHLVNSVTGSQLTQTDVSWNSVLDSTASWRILTNWTIGCTPSHASINTSRSNIRQGSNAVTAGISQYELNQQVNVYPNPASDVVTVAVSGPVLSDANVSIYNIVGELVFQTPIHSSTMNLDISAYPKGVYMLVIGNKGATAFKKLIIN